MENDVLTRSEHIPEPSDALFGWRGGGVVLLGECHDGQWTVARAWLRGDRLTDVRRWSFAAPSAFAGQVRRLVLEATNDGADARARGGEALEWAERRARQAA